MKKNSKKADTQKPEVGCYYKIFDYSEGSLDKSNIMKVLSIKGNIVNYIVLDNLNYIQNWNYKEWPEYLNYKLTSLEVELL